MADKRKPWMKWYTRDWRSNAKLRLCSFAARGLWADMLSLMWESPVCGFLMVEGVVPTTRQLASLLGGAEREIAKLRQELQEAGVFSVTGLDDLPADIAPLIPETMPPGVIFSRRMVRDMAKEAKDRENGKGGGNPKLRDPDKEGVNPPSNPQRSDARDQTSEPNGSGAHAPARDVIFSEALPWLIRKTGKTRDACAKLLGGWCRDYGDDATLAALTQAERENPVEPVAWITAKFKPREAPETWDQRRIREGLEALRQ